MTKVSTNKNIIILLANGPEVPTLASGRANYIIEFSDDSTTWNTS